MPNLSPTIDSILADIVTDWGGVSIEAIAEDAAASIAIDTSATTMIQYWTNTSNVAVQYATAYFEFDTSGITSAPATATLKLYVESITNDGLDFYPCRGFLASDGAIVAGDLPAATRAESGGTPDVNNITKYSAIVDVSEDITASAVNNITLNATAIADMVSKDRFVIVLLNKWIADQTLGGSTTTRGMHISSQDHSTSGQRPILNYELPAAPALPHLFKTKSGIIKLKSGKLIMN